MEETDRSNVEAELHYNASIRSVLDEISAPNNDKSFFDPNIISRLKHIMTDIAEGNWAPWPYRSEAQQLLEAIEPEEENGDLIEAYGIYSDIIWTWTNREAMCKQIDQAICKAIKRGRQLERDEK